MVALLDRDDGWHKPCVEAFQSLPLPLLTSEAVLTELFHMVGDQWHEVEAAWRFVGSGAVIVASLADAETPALRALMTRYRDLPMDFADATLVHLARRESVSTVLTVDQRDFGVYRIDGRRRFRVLPTIASGRA